MNLIGGRLQSEQARSVVEIVIGAGRLTEALMQEGFRYREKGRADFITEIDLRVQRHLRSKLQAVLPAATLVAEESGKERYDGSQMAWIVDPIDGTTNLVHRYPHYAISVALVDNGQSIMAVVLNPATGELFQAVKGGGAYLNNETIEVSRTLALRESLVAFGLPYDRSRAHALFEDALRIFCAARDLRRSGSSTLDLAYVACGRVDAYFEFDLQPWDHAAGSLLVEEAGGRVTGWRSEGVASFEKSDLVASNGRIHEELITALSSR